MSEQTSEYKSTSAREAQAASYGDKTYWDYLEDKAREYHEKGIKDALTRTLSEALAGNDGN